MIIAETDSFYSQLGGIGRVLFWLFITALSALLLFISLYPLFRKEITPKEIDMHPPVSDLGALSIPVFKKIAVALDFSEDDRKIIAHALSQGGKEDRNSTRLNSSHRT